MIKKQHKDLDYITEEGGEPGTVSFSKPSKIKKELKECRIEKANYLAAFQRIQADLINYRNRQEKEREQLGIRIQAETIRDLLPVLDTLNKAVETDKNAKAIRDQFVLLLKQKGLEEIKTDTFNPQFHEAIDVVETKSKKSGEILEEVQKGYTFKGEVLRITKVRIVK